MEKPVEPNKEDCCNSGCNPCIFDIYDKQLKLYEKYLQNGKIIDNLSQENGISQLEYTTFIVTKNVNMCRLHNLITFRRQKLDGKKVWWKPGDHFLYKYISNENTCTRAFTPVKLIKTTDADYSFSIIVKNYNNGLVSTHLYNLNEGTATLWRGPYGHYEIKSNKFDRIIMIAQGTGIVPLIAIIDSILNNEDDFTKIILLYCCRCLDSILFREELYAYKSYWNFKYDIYVSTEVTLPKTKYHEPVHSNKLNLNNIDTLKPFSSKDQFLICGSEQFNNNYKNLFMKEIPWLDNIILL